MDFSLPSNVRSGFIRINGAKVQALTSTTSTKARLGEGMARSVFCLVLKGDTPSTSRLADAIAAGCTANFETILELRHLFRAM